MINSSILIIVDKLIILEWEGWRVVWGRVLKAVLCGEDGGVAQSNGWNAVTGTLAEGLFPPGLPLATTDR